MDVSNSTGQSTGYRVVGAGGTAPDRSKKRGEYLETEDKRRFVEIDGKWCEVLAEGTLEPWTYVTVNPRKRPFVVQFLQNGKPHCLCDVVQAAASRNAKPTELLIALMQNGKSTAETYVCRWKKP